ncbi:hypothetical protein [Massilia soli]|uniref:hypothetical protein n=1 Tax=Massilia soli TaxID=2792854 RepID=UPI001CBADDF2|nr:hypothetical protein [Massilia soli]
MPFSFLLVLMFMLSAFISPFVAIGVIWSLSVKRWHHVGKQAGKCGIGLGVIFIVACIALNAAVGEGSPIPPTSVALSGGAGFTGGALVYCAWVWVKVRKRLASTT